MSPRRGHTGLSIEALDSPLVRVAALTGDDPEQLRYRCLQIIEAGGEPDDLWHLLDTAAPGVSIEPVLVEAWETIVRTRWENSR